MKNPTGTTVRRWFYWRGNDSDGTAWCFLVRSSRNDWLSSIGKEGYLRDLFLGAHPGRTVHMSLNETDGLIMMHLLNS